MQAQATRIPRRNEGFRVHPDLQRSVLYMSAPVILMCGEIVFQAMTGKTDAIGLSLFVVGVYALILARILRMSWVVEKVQPMTAHVLFEEDGKLAWLKYYDEAGSIRVPILVGQKRRELLKQLQTEQGIACKLLNDPWTHQTVAVDIDGELYWNPGPLASHSQLHGGTHPVTNCLIVLNCLALGALALVGDSLTLLAPDTMSIYRAGASLGAGVEPWRLLTAIFLHGGIVHLALNMVALVYFGAIAEKLFGSVRFLLLYLLCGVAGMLTSALMDPATVSVGASGAIFGIVGAMVMYRYVRPETMMSDVVRGEIKVMTLLLAMNIPLLYFLPNIDHAGHVGGFIAGCLLAIALFGNRKQAISGTLACSAALYFAYKTAKSEFLSGSYGGFADGLRYASNAQWQKSADSLTVYLNAHPESTEGHRRRAKAAEAASNYELASTDVRWLLDHTQERLMEYNHIAWLDCACGRYEQALHEANKVLDRKNESNTLDTRGVAYIGLHQYDRAVKDFEEAIRLDEKNAAPYFHLAQIAHMVGRNDEITLRAKANKLGYSPESWEWKI